MDSGDLMECMFQSVNKIKSVFCRTTEVTEMLIFKLTVLIVTIPMHNMGA